MVVVQDRHVSTYTKQNDTFQYLNWMQFSAPPKPRVDQAIGAPVVDLAMPALSAVSST
jgi:hypothetical protein